MRGCLQLAALLGVAMALHGCATPTSSSASGVRSLGSGATPGPKQYDLSIRPQAGSVTRYALGNVSFLALPDIEARASFSEGRILPSLRKQLELANVFGSDRSAPYTLSVTVESVERPPISWNARIDLLAIRYELADHSGEVIYGRRIENSINRSTPGTHPYPVVIEENVSQFVNDLSIRLARIDDRKPAAATAGLATSTQQPVSTRPPVQTAPRQLPQVHLESYSATGVRLGNYHALIIGNNRYQYLQGLQSAVQDARRLEQILRTTYGFETRLLVDANRQRILSEMNEYRKSLTANDNLLIYYAGHGWVDEEADEGYWLPVDAHADNPVNWVSNASLTSTIRAMHAKHVLIVADSCFSGKLTRGVNPQIRSQEYLNRMASKRARTALTSGGLEPVLDSGGKDGHSVFATAFFEALLRNDAVIDMSQMFNYIRRQVALDADQIPEYGDIRRAGHNGGDFLFFRSQ